MIGIRNGYGDRLPALIPVAQRTLEKIHHIPHRDYQWSELHMPMVVTLVERRAVTLNGTFLGDSFTTRYQMRSLNVVVQGYKEARRVSAAWLNASPQMGVSRFTDMIRLGW